MREPWPWVTIEAPTPPRSGGRIAPKVHPYWCDCGGCWTGITVNAPAPRDSWVVRHFLPLAMIAGFVAAAVFVGAFA